MKILNKDPKTKILNVDPKQRSQNEDVETMFVPSYISMVKLGVTGSDEIAQLRHQNLLRNKENRTHIEETDLLNPWILRARDIEVGKVSRELSIIDGVVQGKN